MGSDEGQETMTRWMLGGLASFGFLILVAPLVIVVINAFNADVLLSGWGGGTTKWVTAAVKDEAVQRATLGSITIAGVVTGISAFIGALVVGFSSYAPSPLRRITEGLTLVRIMIPEVIFAAGLIVFVSMLGIGFGTFAVILGHAVWCTAFFIAVASARRAGFDRTLEDAARDLGATPFRTFRTIVIPDLIPGLLAGALLAFTFSFDDVVTTVFLSGPDTRTLPLEILGRIRQGINPTINAIGLLMMAVMLVAYGLMAAIGGLRSLIASAGAAEEKTK